MRLRLIDDKTHVVKPVIVLTKKFTIGQYDYDLAHNYVV